MKKISIKKLQFRYKEVLTREQLKDIFGGEMEEPSRSIEEGGGSSSCRIKVTYSEGGFGSYDTPTSGTCAQQSAQANQQCLTVMRPGSRCSYDCACDGYGR
ncbi:hypothetical protein KRE47_06045 [Elizabethkingia meningoseptica]|uniref:hypothetical protein n=1 Tax=Elizabethkingia meningoseptica TaxID=238 RepID=UPI0023B1B200|nr:hypothetical protein [Elizabethkingia meningoseptica]MDE5467595.1 hypothetical protein [Elizabethkingia meningoseptica]MDE5474514.1 hypothetical protein [Elizabethkingia meningoseptica]MDE5477947.1 hypothetical protein [Elizabethkingia meningoseptica]MDE5485854.1 hypothetical protein [Elizabethkingia meningoseptica]MDE5502062.1 hypothetical protein [Elizabethkingia meningoseptica]